jgi:2'-5' RNA ligase
MTAPLILALQIDDAAQIFYEDLRRRFFPPERNVIPAHLTLFHKLPDEDRTYDAVRKAAQAVSAFRLTHPVLRSTGRGVAVFFEAEQLRVLHAELAAVFEAQLIPQDRQRFRPHIVVQNKVAPDVARGTLALLEGSSFVEPFAVGITIWRYLGGPWEHVLDVPFGARS